MPLPKRVSNKVMNSLFEILSAIDHAAQCNQHRQRHKRFDLVGEREKILSDRLECQRKTTTKTAEQDERNEWLPHVC